MMIRCGARNDSIDSPIFERAKTEFDIDRYGRTPEDLARATAKIYLSSRPASDNQSAGMVVHEAKDQTE